MWTSFLLYLVRAYLNDLSTIPGSRACVCWSMCGKHLFTLKCPKQSQKNPKIEIGQNVKDDVETHSNGFLTAENNVFLDFVVIPGICEKRLKFHDTILIRKIGENVNFVSSEKSPPREHVSCSMSTGVSPGNIWYI